MVDADVDKTKEVIQRGLLVSTTTSKSEARRKRTYLRDSTWTLGRMRFGLCQMEILRPFISGKTLPGQLK